MSYHMPPLKVSPNTWRGKTVGLETGRRNDNEPRFDGHWVVREGDGTLIDYYRSQEYIKKFYRDALYIMDVNYNHPNMQLRIPE